MSEVDKEVAVHETSEAAEQLKNLGNEAFSAKDFSKALDLFTQAIALDNGNAKYFVNRSICHASLGNWKGSALDARRAIQLDNKYIKAHCRLVKALIELTWLRDARYSLLTAFKDCGEHADLKALEKSIQTLTGIPLRPKSTDFEIQGELGEGNFSKVYKCKHKQTNVEFAIKTIERQTVDKMKKRHPNIHNEILMEKKVLQRFDHPHLVTLYSTFQDYGTLYYQMEYIQGSDLWSLLHDHVYDAKTDTNTLTEQVGLHWSCIVGYFSQIVSAVEHMHQHGVVHRDLKPENVMVAHDGKLKLVDFGTCKDLIDPSLNGPEFVGTAEYMSPNTVQSKKGTSIGIDADLWALGVLLYQMALGTTPFAAPSPYLTFLRIKRGKVVLPHWVPTALTELIHSLLTLDTDTRISNNSNVSSSSSDAAALKALTYDKMRGRKFFTEAWETGEDGTAKETLPNPPMEHDGTRPFPPSPPAATGADFVHSHNCPPIPTLRDLCIRAVGKTAIRVNIEISSNGGIKPKDKPWVGAFNLHRLPALDRHRVMHYLDRSRQLNQVGIYRMFVNSYPEARCTRASVDWKEVMGLYRAVEGDWSVELYYLVLNHINKYVQAPAALKALVSKINKLRVKIVVVMGNLTQANTTDAKYDEEIIVVRNNLARLTETINVVFVPGPIDLGFFIQSNRDVTLQLSRYRNLFGADYYGFWYIGLRGLVVNSTLLCYPQADPEEAKKQDIWLEEEVEQSKLCANTVIVFTYHPWFLDNAEEEDVFEDEEKIKHKTIPRSVRLYWLQKLRHHKVRMIFTSYDQADKEVVGAGRRPFHNVNAAPRPPSPPPKEFVEALPDDAEALPPSELVKLPGGDHEDSHSEDGKEAEGEKTEEDETYFANEEADYDGPAMFAAPAPTIEVQDIIRVVKVTENDAEQKIFIAEQIPASAVDLAASFT